MNSYKPFYALLAVLMFLLSGCGEENDETEGDAQLKKIEGDWGGTIQVPNQPLAEGQMAGIKEFMK